MIQEEIIQPSGCSFTLLACSFQLKQKHQFTSPRKNVGKVSLSRTNSNRSQMASSLIFNSISEVIVTEPNTKWGQNANVGVQTDYSTFQKENGLNYDHVNESTAKYSSSLPLQENKSILIGSGNQGMGGVINQLNEITLYENKNPRRETVTTEIFHSPQNNCREQRRIHTQRDEDYFRPKKIDTPFDKISKECFSSSTCKNSILKSSCMFAKPLLKRSQMRQTGFSHDFSNSVLKKSNNHYVETVASTYLNKNSQIQNQRQNEETKPLSQSFMQKKIINPQFVGNNNQPLSPPCSNKIKTLVDLDCKSTNSYGNGDKTSSYHISIAASLNSSGSVSAITDQDRIFRTIKQMTLKNITQEGVQPNIFVNRFA